MLLLTTIRGRNGGAGLTAASHSHERCPSSGVVSAIVAFVGPARYSASMTTTRRSARGFLSYAHGDRRLVEQLRRLMTPRLQIDRRVEFSVWSDDLILVGQLWDDEIRRAMAASDFALLLLSPTFLSRDCIRGVELPTLTASTTAVMPVGLRRVDFERSDAGGLEARQVFSWLDPRSGEHRWFAELGGENRERFCDRLAAEITERLLAPRP